MKPEQEMKKAIPEQDEVIRTGALKESAPTQERMSGGQLPTGQQTDSGDAATPASRSRKRLLLIVLMALLLMIIGFILWTWLFNRPAVINSKGRHAYQSEDFAGAERQFRANSLRPEPDSIASANLARSQYKQGKYDQTEQTLNSYLDSPSRQHQSNAWYDLGNASFRLNKYQEALDSYKQALLLNPSNEDAKANYELALQKLQQQQNQPQEEQPRENEQKEDILNRLRALDRVESQDRQQQQRPANPQEGKWW